MCLEVIARWLCFHEQSEPRVCLLLTLVDYEVLHAFLGAAGAPQSLNRPLEDLLLLWYAQSQGQDLLLHTLFLQTHIYIIFTEAFLSPTRQKCFSSCFSNFNEIKTISVPILQENRPDLACSNNVSPTFFRFWMDGSVLGRAALQNILSRDMASSRICLRVLVLASRLLTHP